MISPDTVKKTLLPWLGSAFLSAQEELCIRLSMSLLSYQAQRDTLTHLAQQLDNLLFMAVRETTQGRMALEMDTGQLIRLRMSDFGMMADELLYLLFDTLEKTSFHLSLIREYSMRSGSLSALRALYLLYPHLQTQEEVDILRRVITTSHEPWRFSHWIDQTN